jgi:hypothetical protein
MTSEHSEAQGVAVSSPPGRSGDRPSLERSRCDVRVLVA